MGDFSQVEQAVDECRMTPERRGRLPAQPDSGLGVGGWCVPEGEFLNLCVPLLLS